MNTSRLLALGLNQPNVQHGNCGSTISGRGECRHLHHCLQVVIVLVEEKVHRYLQHCLQVVIFLVEENLDIYTIAQGSNISSRGECRHLHHCLPQGSNISGRGECRHLHHCLKVVIFLVEENIDIYVHHSL